MSPNSWAENNLELWRKLEHKVYSGDGRTPESPAFEGRHDGALLSKATRCEWTNSSTDRT